MSKDKDEIGKFSASDMYAEGSAEAVNDAMEKMENNNSREVRTENLTLVNHHHQHFYGNPNANPEENNNQGSLNLMSTLVKIGLGAAAVYSGVKLISSGGKDIKRIEEDKQKAIEAIEEKQIKAISLHEEEKYSWYRYDEELLLQSNDLKTDKQYLFSIFETKELTICLFNRESPIYNKFGEKDITINNPSSNIIYKIFNERLKDTDGFKHFFYIEEVPNDIGLYDSHFEREKEGRVKRAQYKVTSMYKHIKLEFIKIK